MAQPITFKIYQQKRGVGVRFPLERVIATRYLPGMIKPEIEEELGGNKWLQGEKLMAVIKRNELTLYPEKRFFEHYEDASHQDYYKHEFEVKKPSKRFSKPDLQECKKCQKVERLLFSINNN